MLALLFAFGWEALMAGLLREHWTNFAASSDRTARLHLILPLFLLGTTLVVIAALAMKRGLRSGVRRVAR